MTTVRIAPSPTGIPHIGNTRTALFNYLFAKKTNGKFILRIEDTDRNRIVEGAMDAIEQIMDWLGMHYDEKFIQSERIDIYKKHAEELVELGLAYQDDGAIRFKMPEDGVSEWTDAIGNKKISFENKNQEDFIILKSDGYPTYHLANVIDDHFMDVTHVIRGDEWISSTPKHIQLYLAFKWDQPVFGHLPVILGSDKTKLSKRHGALSVLDYRKEGYLKEGLINYMALLGWSPKDETEFFTMETLQERFSLEGINTGSPIFDIAKLKWINALHIRSFSASELKARLIEFDKENERVLSHSRWEEIIEISKSRIELLSEFKPLTLPFFGNEKRTTSSLKKELSNTLSQIDVWEKENILKVLLDFMKEKNIRFPVLYGEIIDEKRGLPLADVFYILEKKDTLALLGE